MRKSVLLISLAAIASVGLFARGSRGGDDLQKRYRLRRISGATSMASPAKALLESTEDCPLAAGVPEAIGPNFDPDLYDEISIAGNGRLVAYATQTAQLPIPGMRVIVIQREGGDAETVSEGSGENDQPSIDLDKLGSRLAFRGPGGSRGADTDIYVRTVTRRGNGLGGEFPTTETTNLTDIGNGNSTFASYPSLTARTLVTEIDGSGITFIERDARLAFISDGDFDKDQRRPNHADPGHNEENVEQLFIWREKDRRFTQATRNTDPDVRMARPSISGNGKLVAFECTADLVPDATNPRDATQVGNPDNVRQIYLWRRTRKGQSIIQLTFGDRASYAPRIAANGSQVLFCSRADLVPGGNPEGNYEIFRHRRGTRAARRLAQLTQTPEGENVLPRPTRSPGRFVFYSTAAPPAGGATFGLGPRQCGPTALLWTRGRVRLVGGLLDLEQIGNAPNLIFVGPPAATFASKIHFATNDPQLDPPPLRDDDDDPTNDPPSPGTAGPTQLHLARATRFARR